jgi:hypothetical protein
LFIRRRRERSLANGLPIVIMNIIVVVLTIILARVVAKRRAVQLLYHWNGSWVLMVIKLIICLD